jgi:hypothetical protein
MYDLMYEVRNDIKRLQGVLDKIWQNKGLPSLRFE